MYMGICAGEDLSLIICVFCIRPWHNPVLVPHTGHYTLHTTHCMSPTAYHPTDLARPSCVTHYASPHNCLWRMAGGPAKWYASDRGNHAHCKQAHGGVMGLYTYSRTHICTCCTCINTLYTHRHTWIRRARFAPSAFVPLPTASIWKQTPC